MSDTVDTIAIEVERARYRYPAGPQAVDGIDFAARPGELVGLLGPNGAGKSTLLGLCSGRLRPDEGRVSIGGQDAAHLRPRERARRVACVPQALEAVPEVLVHDFVSGGRYAHLSAWKRPALTDRDAVRAALDRTDVGDLADRPLTALSGGQLQRVLVARAIAQATPVLLVDEPTGSLDPAHQLEVFDLLRELADDGRAVVVVTHDLNLAGQYADRLVLLAAGRIAAQGAPGEVLGASVLEPVYGARLYCGRFPAAGDRAGEPLVLPWRRRRR